MHVFAEVKKYNQKLEQMRISKHKPHAGRRNRPWPSNSTSEGPSTSSVWICRKSAISRYPRKPRFLSLVTLSFDLWP